MRLQSFFAILFCIVLLVEAVDRHKFRNCDNTGFCKRNRKLTQRGASPYQIIPSSIQTTSNSLTTDVINTLNNHTFVFEITSAENGILHFKANEKNPLRPRYQVKDVIKEDLKAAPLYDVRTADTSVTAYFGSGSGVGSSHKYHFRLDFSPIKLDLFADNILLISTNERGLFNIEHLRDKAQLPHVEHTHEHDNEAPNENEAIHEAEEGIAPSADIPENLVTEEPPVTQEELVKEDLTDAWEESFSTFQDSKPNGPTSISLDFTFIGARNVYGIPEHSDSMSLQSTTSHQPYRLYNLDVFEYELDNTMALYGSVPMMIAQSTGRTCGVLWLNAAETFIDVKDGIDSHSRHRKETHFFSESGIIDVYFMLGPQPKDVFRQYADLTGTAALPQLFAIAYHQCRWNYKSEDDVKFVDSSFDSNDLQYDVLWLDIEHTDGKRYFTWDPINFPNPVIMQADIKAKGRKMVVIIDPHIKRDTGYYIHKDAQSKDLYIKDKNGNEYDGWCWSGSSGYLDFTNPEVRNWWASNFHYDKYQGSTDILYVWNDMNEPSVFNGPEVSMHKDAVHHQGWEHRDVHNMYGFYMHMATAQGLVERSQNKNDRPFVLSRAFFAGSQRYGAIWTGDNAAQWSHLKAAQPMLLTLGIAGITFSGADVGGFFGNPEDELLTRWYQAAAFHPFFRGHAHLDARRREPYLLPEPYLSVVRTSIRIRYTLLPFWYTTFHENTLTGLPVMRPLWVEFTDDFETFDMDDEFLVGSALLVKPVSSSGQQTTEVYLPGATTLWYDFFTFKSHPGGRRVTFDTPLEKMPVLQRGGSIIPKKERPRRSSLHMTDDPYTLQVALDSQGSAVGELYIDDGHSFDYQKGQYHRRKFTFDKNTLTSKSIGSNTCKACGSEAVVERVVVAGVEKKPSKVTVTVGGKTSDLTFEYSGNQLVVRKPNVRIDQDWEIVFN
eukprot:TRINITY_DN4699_c0_g2_i2.p1 TRINITY_DN4699_c0_g2~~TRINITY_DN4699_c0_g2_i2.p1  ORF type:complete len:945 (+),score=243.39 TRINITY_DN4699_c0_g2_i2:232-3066(+)